jgi:predicted  nucleic acid-binding Zn-ribbon protein
VDQIGPALGTGGGLLVFSSVIFALLRSNRADRGQANTQIKDAEKRADAAERRAERIQKLLDEARQERRAAEDREAAIAREMAKLRDQVEGLTNEVARLRETVT